MRERRRTICNRDCPDACGIVATAEDGRVVRLEGDRDHPVTRGFLCYRTSQFLRSQYSPNRLVSPLVRRGGRHVAVGWDEVLDHLARELARIRDRDGPEAIFHYRSGGTLGMVVAQASALFFERFGPVTVKRGDICSGAGEAAQQADFGASDSNDLFDLERARHVLLWGKNVHTSSPHTMAVLRRARERGAELTLIDPVHHPRGVSLCQEYVQPRPGGDFALAMAALSVVFDNGWEDPRAGEYCLDLDGLRALARSEPVEEWCRQADVAPRAAADLARRMADGPTAILVGWGMARRQNGGAIVRALDALGAVTGNVGVPGGGVSYYFRRGAAFRKLATAPPPRTVCEPLFGQEVLAMRDPPIHAVWITAGNPVAMLPDSGRVAEALSSRELTVVVDSWLSDTAALADVVLPTTTLLEADDLCGAYGHHFIGEARPVVEPPPGVRSDLWIFQALAERLGLRDPELAGSTRAFKERLLGDELVAHGIGLDELCTPRRRPTAPEVLFADRRFPTPSGKVELITSASAAAAAPNPDYPMLLTSVSTPASQSSQWAKEPPRPLPCTVHPDSAGGVGDGELAWLESALGRIEVNVRHDPRQRRDVALVPKGGHYRDGAAANAITRARLTDMGEGGALYDEPVRLCPRHP